VRSHFQTDVDTHGGPRLHVERLVFGILKAGSLNRELVISYLDVDEFVSAIGVSNGRTICIGAGVPEIDLGLGNQAPRGVPHDAEHRAESGLSLNGGGER
jgi:hypothetical protein